MGGGNPIHPPTHTTFAGFAGALRSQHFQQTEERSATKPLVFAALHPSDRLRNVRGGDAADWGGSSGTSHPRTPLPLSAPQLSVACKCVYRFKHLLFCLQDSNGLPKSLTNSRGKIRNPSTKDLNTVLRVYDGSFLDFLKKCLM